MNLEQAADKFLYYEQIVIGKSDLTIKSYREDLTQFISYLHENEEKDDLTQVTNLTIRSFMAFLDRKGISKRSINRKLSAIRGLFDFALKRNFVVLNPVEFVLSPKFQKNLPSVLNESEVKKIIDSVDVSCLQGIRDRALIELLYSSGLRAAELIGLSEYQIDFEYREIRVVGKGEKERVTFFSNTAKEWVLKYISEKKRETKAYTKDFIFANLKGGHLTDRSLRRIIEGYSKKAGILKEVTPHTFRHTFATVLLNKGMDIRMVQELLGHSSIVTTQVYTHVSKDLLRDIYLKTHPFAK